MTMMSKEERIQIAETIRQQLGGNRFAVFTGARNFVALENGGLSFRLPNNAKNGINTVTVELTPLDTYSVKFARVSSYRGQMKHSVKASYDDVYCDQLVSIFESTTGLYTHF